MVVVVVPRAKARVRAALESCGCGWRVTMGVREDARWTNMAVTAAIGLSCILPLLFVMALGSRIR